MGYAYRGHESLSHSGRLSLALRAGHKHTVGFVHNLNLDLPARIARPAQQHKSKLQRLREILEFDFHIGRDEANPKMRTAWPSAERSLT